MPALELQELQACCQKIVTEGADQFVWSWDEGFEAVLAQVDQGQAVALHDLVSRHFPPSWKKENSDQASFQVRQISESLGGIRTQQELFVLDGSKVASLVAAWWPWQNGTQFSLRFLLWAWQQEMGDLPNELRGWFGV